MGYYGGFRWWEVIFGIAVLLTIAIAVHSIAPLVSQIAWGVFLGVLLVGVFSGS